MTKPFLKSLVALLAAVLFVAGCGSGSSTKDFKKDYTKADNALRVLGVDLSKAVRGASKSTDLKLAKTFDGLQSRAKKIASDLGDLKPPDNVKSDLAKLKSGVDLIVNDLGAIADALRAHSAPRSKAATQKLFRDAPAVRDSSAAIRKAEGIKRPGD